MGTTACCHQESSPEPPHARTSSSSASPSTAAQSNRKPPCFKRTRSHRPRHDRSPDESVRTVQSFAVRVRFVHAPPPGIASAVARRRPPPANFPVRRCRSLPSPPVTDTGDSPVTRSTRPSQLG
uniref:Uncharacterized protein n=1 Tax=Brassica oleracea TaxID=3712 RepID=A0A3P6DZ88_BRAOL|nr:unnamed protein product [Brassica oleracea]